MLKRIKYQLYLFQLENYKVSRYLAFIPRFFGKVPKQLRQKLAWTSKLKALLGLALVLQVATAAVLGFATAQIFFSGNFLFAAVLGCLWFLALYFLHFVFLLSAHALLIPLDRSLKRSLIARAKAKIAAVPDLKVIGIVGSYGKTTMKEMVSTVLKQDYKVLQTPESINTPLGIARLILEKLTPQTQVFVMEMGEHEPGDIRDICNIAKPDLGIITGINEAHLERMGNIDRTIGTIFEIAGVPGASPILMNADDELVRGNYENYLGAHRPLFYSSKGQAPSEYLSRNEEFGEDASGRSFELWRAGEKVGEFRTKLLAGYAIGAAVAAVMIGSEFEVPPERVRAAVAELVPVPHRLEPVPNKNGVIVIDDSYNGNPEGVREAIHVLGNFRNRRKIYVTPGLVEMGARSREIHYNIGTQLAAVADRVVLVRNSVTSWIAEGLRGAGFSEADIVFFESASEAHAGISGIVRPGDVVLFQNDWPDNYF